MSREVRRVRPGWEHPTCENGHFIPLLDGFAAAVTDYERDPIDWGNERPLPEDYMPDWSPEEATAWCLYETTSEGTPVSPVFATRSELVDWLSSEPRPIGIGGRPLALSRDRAEAFVSDGYAPTMVFSPAFGLVSGMEAPR